jgi:uncharacterized membrane protein YciS (DUF1049 family)
MIRTVMMALREVVALFVGDGALALGVLIAVGIAALLAVPLGAGDALGWVLFGLVWAAIGVSLGRANTERVRSGRDHRCAGVRKGGGPRG